jgi:hypothetical protein
MAHRQSDLTLQFGRIAHAHRHDLDPERLRRRLDRIELTDVGRHRWIAEHRLAPHRRRHLFEQFHPFFGRAPGVGWELGPRYALWDGFMTRLTTMAAMPASTALAIGDFRMSVIGLDPDACS